MIYSKYPLKVLQEVEPFPPIQNTDNPYLTEAAMYADQANQLQGYGYLVDGVGAFIYLGTVAGSSADYEPFGGAKTRTRKEVSVTTQYTLIAADFTDFYLDFTADAGQTISLILNAGVMPDNGELRAISSGNNFIVPTVGAGTVIFIKPDSANLKTIPFAWFGIVKATAADTYSVNGSLESNVVIGLQEELDGKVSLAGIETVTGQKTFLEHVVNDKNILLKYGGTIMGIPGYTRIAAVDSKTVVLSNGAESIYLKFTDVTGAKFFEYPNKSGTIALIDDIGLDLRASNLAADLSTSEQDGIKTKVDINSYGLKVVNIDTQYLTTYDLLETSQIPTLYVFNNSGSTDSVLVTIKEGTTCPHIFISARAFGGSSGGSPGTLSIAFDANVNSFLPDQFTNKINDDGTVELLLEDFNVVGGYTFSTYTSKGDFIRLFETFQSPNGTLYKVGVDDTGARTSIAL